MDSNMQLISSFNKYLFSTGRHSKDLEYLSQLKLQVSFDLAIPLLGINPSHMLPTVKNGIFLGYSLHLVSNSKTL